MDTLSLFAQDGNTTLKRCPTCPDPEENHWHPATPEFFHRNKNTKDGFSSQCKNCRSQYRAAYYAEHIEEERQRNAIYGAAHREELRQYSAQYRLDHPEEVKQYSTRYNEEHREEHRLYKVVYNAAHREERRIYRSQWHEVHREHELEYGREYNATHREERRAYDRQHREQRNGHSRRYRSTEHGRTMHRIQENKRNARKRAVSGTYTASQIAEQLKRQGYKCYYADCGFSKFKRVKENGSWKYDYEIEHTFPLARVAGTDIPANDMSYLVLACPSCNARKNNKFPWEWPQGGRLL